MYVQTYVVQTYDRLGLTHKGVSIDLQVSTASGTVTIQDLECSDFTAT